MNLLGIDVGTTGCKVAIFSLSGEIQSLAYREYDPQNPEQGWAQLDAVAIWEELKSALREVMKENPRVEFGALSVSSLGEAVVPVSKDRQILGPSILNYDVRGAEFLDNLASRMPNAQLYAINGNTLGNHYGLTKLSWIQAHRPDLYARAYKFLPWGSFIAYMLGADPVVDGSLANRSLLSDIHSGDWSEILLGWAAIDRQKLPAILPAGTPIGTLAPHVARELGLPRGLPIINGTHDQCANALGCGVIEPGSTVYGMGTYHCITPVFTALPEPPKMIERGLNTEPHAIPGRFVCFIYNQGGALVKWYRDTFAAAEYDQSREQGRSIYPLLFDEIPHEPGRLIVLPHLSLAGPPRFITDSGEVISGLQLPTTRGEILKAIIEGVAFNLKEAVVALPATGIKITGYRVVGGGSLSDVWVQTCADITGQSFYRPQVKQAGALGAAILAGVGARIFTDYSQAVDAMVRLERTFEPDTTRHTQYQDRFTLYRRMAAQLVGDLELRLKDSDNSQSIG